MDRDKYRVNFEELVEKVKRSPHGCDDLAIWGGMCAGDTLVEFLNGWPLERMPYRIWESTDRITFEKEEKAQVPNVALLERGRLFGPGGDLDLRRDGDEFRWRFVGDTDMHPSESEGYDADDFWAQDENKNAVFHCYEEKTAMLWGKRKGNRWHDNRVAAAELDYPEMDGAERVEVKYKVYSRAGRVEFVWLTGLRDWREENDG